MKIRPSLPQSVVIYLSVTWCYIPEEGNPKSNFNY